MSNDDSGFNFGCLFTIISLSAIILFIISIKDLSFFASFGILVSIILLPMIVSLLYGIGIIIHKIYSFTVLDKKKPANKPKYTRRSKADRISIPNSTPPVLPHSLCPSCHKMVESQSFIEEICYICADNTFDHKCYKCKEKINRSNNYFYGGRCYSCYDSDTSDSD